MPQLPLQFQAAIALRAALASSISPPQENLDKNPIELVNNERFTTVLIVVGKKP